MKNRKLYLHIGTEKTGTTSIQEFFHANRELLKNECSLLYPNFGYSELAQFELVAALHPISNNGRVAEFAPKKEYDADKVWLEFCDRIRKTSYEKVLVSVEHFSSRIDESGIRYISKILSENLSDFEIVVIVYLRNQVDMFQSAYSTYIKTGGTQSIFDLATKIHGTGLYYNYYNLIKLWIKYFGQNSVIVRNFDRIPREIGVVDDIIDVLEIKTNGTHKKIESNKTWNPVFLEFCRTLNNGILKDRDHGTRYESYSRLLEKYQHFNEYNGYSLLSKELIEDISSLFSNSNKMLNQLLHGTKNDFFPDFKQKKEPYNYDNFVHDLSSVLFHSK
ncbi:sulfotransferase domain-containing protein [Vibrio alginolyticus]|uniref:sulfotransferase domain-containing protein n=1 Tax=Vibrio alginolyticus TaxID=663 RepID=UPI0022DE69D3|nr:sulfotransferase domain-containing protein [Vibrio alginolyticus]MDA0420469.1 sulfotransferase domain-containing protein [Vibrio alginolyticus]